MTFRVIILPQAHRDIDRNADWWADHHSASRSEYFEAGPGRRSSGDVNREGYACRQVLTATQRDLLVASGA